jgi:hypothetical protein
VEPTSRLQCLSLHQETNVEVSRVTGQACNGEDCELKDPSLSMKFPAKSEDYALCAKFYGTTQDLLASRKLTTRHADVREVHLQRVLEGLRELKEGDIRRPEIG